MAISSAHVYMATPETNIPIAQTGIAESRLNALVFLTLGFSAAGYYSAGFVLSNVKGSAGVHQFLSLFCGLFVLYALAVFGLSARRVRLRAKTVVPFIIGVGVVFRILTLPAGISDGVTFTKIKDDITGKDVAFDRFLLLDHDVWRFLWDGRQQSVGVNPYRHPPIHFSEDEDAQDGDCDEKRAERERIFTDDHWRDIFENLNHKELSTVYPPGMQLCFRFIHCIAPGSVFAWKLFLLFIDTLVGLFIWAVLNRLNLSPWKLAVYFWNPLVIKEGVGSGHADALVALTLVGLALALAREKPFEIGVWFAGAVLMKLAPVVLFPFLISRLKICGCVTAGLVISVVCAPFLAGASLDGFSAYSQEWVFNPGVFEIFRWAALRLAIPLDLTILAKIICAATFLSLLFLFRRRLVLRGDAFPDALLLIQGGALFFSPAVMPWYFIWITPLAAIAGKRSWILYGGLSLFSYLVYADGSGIEPMSRLLVIHGGFFLAWIFEIGAAASVVNQFQQRREVHIR